MIINELTIYTTDVSKQYEFYHDVLGLEVVNHSEDKNVVSVRIGRSILNIVYRESMTPYHFAINIPSNQEREALEWLQQRVDILKEKEIDIHYFDFWNAYAIYFYDVDQNIVEFIARKNLDNISTAKFDRNSLIEISEIGLPTVGIEQMYSHLQDKYKLEIYSGSFESFCAIGDEHGLFICVDKNRKPYWYPTKDKPYISDFKLNFEQLETKFEVEFTNGIIKNCNKLK